VKVISRTFGFKTKKLEVALVLSLSILTVGLVNATYAQKNNTLPTPLSSSIGEANITEKPSIDMTSKIQQLIQSSAKVNITEAVNLIEDSLGTNSTVNSIGLQISNGGFLIFTATAIDPQGRAHEVVVDAGNGKVLLDRPVTLNQRQD